MRAVTRARLTAALASVGFALLTAAACSRSELPGLLPGDSQDAGLEGGEVQDATLDRGQVHGATLEARTDANSDVSFDTSFDAGPLPDVVLPLCKAVDAGQDAGPCTGLACQVQACGGNPAATTVSGYVYAANGMLPLFNVEVFIPNAPLKPIPNGVQCSQCGDNVSGDPITTTSASRRASSPSRACPPARTITWATSPSPEGPRVFTVDTPVGVASDKQCGRGVHIDAHVDEPPTQEVEKGYPTTGCGLPLKADEAAFVFFFFDLSSCSETCD